MKKKLFTLFAIMMLLSFVALGCTKVTDDPNPVVIPKYTVTFNSNQGSAVTTQTINEGGLVTEPTTPTRKNYTFDGWFCDFEEDGMVEEKKWDFKEYKVEKNITLNAHWIQNAFELSFVTNAQETFANQDITIGELATEPLWVNGKEGHTFVGWFTSSTFDTKFDFSVELDRDRTLYARWYENKVIDGSFSDWSEAELANYIVARGHGNATETRGFTLYAKYVTGAGLWLIGYGDHNTTPTSPRADWWRFTNAEWQINGSGNDYINNNGDFKINGYKEGDAESSKGVMITKAKTDEGYENISNNFRTFFEIFYPEDKIPNKVVGGPQRIGFSFMASHANNTQKDDKIVGENAAIGNRGSDYNWMNTGLAPSDKSNGYYVYDDMTGRGIFINENRSAATQTVTFNVGLGTAVDPQTVTIGSKLNKPANPINNGYEFGGWYKNSACTIAWDFINDKVYQGYSLYAKWTALETELYEVVFENNGATENAAQNLNNIIIGSKITKPNPDPLKTGYLFIDWYESPTFDGSPWKFTTDTIKFNQAKKITLYARWQELEAFDITFDVDGGSAIATQTVMTGDYAVRPTDFPTKAGHIFGGWYKDVERTIKFSFTTEKILSAQTIYAKWDKTTLANTNSEIMGIRDDRGTGIGFDVSAWLVAGGVQIRYVIYHNNAVVTNKGAWYENTNAEFWIGSAQYYYTLGSQASSLNGGTGSHTTVAGSTLGFSTNYVTTIDLFVVNSVALDGELRMQFAVKPDGGGEQMKITGFTATGGLDAWWMVSLDTVRAYRGVGNTFGVLLRDQGRFYVTSSGLSLTAKA